MWQGRQQRERSAQEQAFQVSDSQPLAQNLSSQHPSSHRTNIPSGLGLCSTEHRSKAMVAVLCILLSMFGLLWAMEDLESSVVSWEDELDEDIIQKAKQIQKYEIIDFNETVPEFNFPIKIPKSKIQDYANNQTRQKLNQQVIRELVERSYVPKAPFNQPPVVKNIKFGTIVEQAAQAVVQASLYTETTAYQPNPELPLCLIARVHDMSLEQQQGLLRSIYSQNYDNYLLLVLGSQGSMLSKQKIGSMSIRYTPPSRHLPITFAIPAQTLTYYDYRYLVHRLCDANSVIVFVSQPLANQKILASISRQFQNYNQYVIYSDVAGHYNVFGCLMRVFDLLDTNDFDGTNKKYLLMDDSEKFIGLGLLELARYKAKKLWAGTIFAKGKAPAKAPVLLSFGKDDREFCTRTPYQPLFSLRQQTQVNVTAQLIALQNLNKGSEVAYSPNPRTQLSKVDMFRALSYQQTLNLPFEHGMHIKQRQYYNRTYGYLKNEDKPFFVPRPETRFCVTVIGNINKAGQTDRYRYLNNMRTILYQNYTNYHIVYIDNGLPAEVSNPIKQLLASQSPGSTFVSNPAPRPTTYNILNAAVNHCATESMQLVIDNDFQLVGSSVLQLFNDLKNYNPYLWTIYANFKTSAHGYGYAYRIMTSGQYRTFAGRVRGLQFLPRVAAWEVRLIRSIPLVYLQEVGHWIDELSYYNLQYCLAELSTFPHMEYAPEIVYECPEDKAHLLVQNRENMSRQERTRYEETQQYIHGLKSLEPLMGLEQRHEANGKILKQKIDSTASFQANQSHQ